MENARFDTLTTQVEHPLEPLSASEIEKAVRILKNKKNLSSTTRFVSVVLKEPLKQTLRHFRKGTPFERKAFFVLFDNALNACYEALVNISTEELASWKHVPGVQPSYTADEMEEMEEAVRESKEFQALMKKYYGVTDMSLVCVDIWGAGNYGEGEETGPRLARPLCFLKTDPSSNQYAKPIEGLKPIVDVNQMKVIAVEDLGYWPLPPNKGVYQKEHMEGKFRTSQKPIEIQQPEGPSFYVEGNRVVWEKWDLIIGFNAREGLTLHQIGYYDKGHKRPILYRASISEMVVPYGDPHPSQNRKNAFDIGEYGIGTCANSLSLGCDCLGLIYYFDAHLLTSKGDLWTIKNAICMHEEDYGIGWKHTDRRQPSKTEVRRSRRLVISSIYTVENYDYGYFWYFYLDGTIEFEVKLTGILSMGAAHLGETPKYGNMIDTQLYAPNHQHFLNARLDFDLDAGPNSLYQLDVVAEEEENSGVFKNAFYAKATLYETELQARAHIHPPSNRSWKVVNDARKNKVGQSVAYKLIPGTNSSPFAPPGAAWRKRCGFVDYQVYGTPFKEEEMFGSGDYPNHRGTMDGILKWQEQNRPLKDADLVLWYTIGHTHVARPEDYPVMPTAYEGFMLKPFGFFDENPANDVPPSHLGNSRSECCSK
jgi:primary-amine oxidase